MAELNVTQITEKLNQEFEGEQRKLVFWYDAAAEFADDISTIKLENASILILEQRNQFKTKHFLECVDTESNYLIYAPFPKPGIRENHLADTLLYSREFQADRASLLMMDLGINERFKPILQTHIKFFAAKERTRKFYDLSLDDYGDKTIPIGMMSVLSKSKYPTLEDVLRDILLHDGFAQRDILDEFEKYHLVEPFWEMIHAMFGYRDDKPSIRKLLIAMFITYIEQDRSTNLPAWQRLVCGKSGSVIAFLR